MFRGNWFKHPALGVALFALVAVLILAVNPPDQVDANWQSADQVQSNQGDLVEAGPPSRRGVTGGVATKQRPENGVNWNLPADFWWDTLAQWVMAIGTIATIALVLWTLCVTRGMLREARLATEAATDAVIAHKSQLTLAFPVKITIETCTFFEVCKTTGDQIPGELSPGKSLVSAVWFMNNGRDIAKVTKVVFEPVFCKNIPDMDYERQRNKAERGNSALRRDGKDILKLDPGEWAYVTADFTCPNDIKTQSLYYIGHIRYKDSLNTHRRLKFIRKFNSETCLFENEAHPDLNKED